MVRASRLVSPSVAPPILQRVGDEAVSYAGARAPERTRTVDSSGAAITVHEWGDASAPCLYCIHGGFDFARTFDVFAPLLADAGWRVVSWDQRGHGDSAYAELYSFEADLRDATAVMDATTDRPGVVVAHSKGGSMAIQLADAQPFRFSHMVNLDGIPYRRPVPDVAEHERTRMLASDVAGWLDHRRRTVAAQRRPGTLDELAERRAQMNPRLSHDWLRYLVSVGARHDPDGWRWKIDPTMRMGGFGPWRPEWTIMRLPGLAMPFLSLLGTEPDVMSWGTLPHHVKRFLPTGGRCEVVEGVGHFVHIERPVEVAATVLEFVGRPR